MYNIEMYLVLFTDITIHIVLWIERCIIILTYINTNTHRNTYWYYFTCFLSAPVYIILHACNTTIVTNISVLISVRWLAHTMCFEETLNFWSKFIKAGCWVYPRFVALVPFGLWPVHGWQRNVKQCFRPSVA